MKKHLLFGVLMLVFLAFTGCSVSSTTVQESISQEVKDIAESYKLTDISVVVRDEGKHSDYQLFYFDIISSNFGSLSFDQMLDLAKEMDAISYPDVLLIPGNYKSGDDTWRIFESGRSIDKNGEDVYNDYENSSIHKEAGSNNIPNNYTGTHDATLKMTGEDSVLICISEDAMDRCMTALNNGYEGTIDEMISNKEIGFTERNTKCNIIDKQLTKAQVKLLDGSYAGNTVWVVIESLQDK